MQPEQAGLRDPEEIGNDPLLLFDQQRDRASSDLCPREINQQIAQFEKMKELEAPPKLKNSNSSAFFGQFFHKQQ